MPGVTAAAVSSLPSLISAGTGLLDALFGGGTTTTGEATGTGTQKTTFDTLVTGKKRGTEKRFLDIEEEGVQKIMADILGGTEGLAEIFSEQGAAGLYSTSVAAQASGDLVTKLAGEIAKLTAKEVTEFDITEEAAKTGVELAETETFQKTKQEEEDEGFFGGLFG